MSKGDRFWRNEERKAARVKAEAEGRVADSMEVRIALMERVNRSEITLEAAQAELKAIKRGAKRRGLTTRAASAGRGAR